METADGRNIAQFTRKGFVFSRIAPYEDWDRFAHEASRLWGIYVKLTEPSEVERLGVRFINRLLGFDFDSLDRTLTLPPRSPAGLDLPVSDFLHRSLFVVPGYPYNVNVIQTSQPPMPPENASALIVDVDVFTTGTIELNDTVISARLEEMHWLKNAFFNKLLTTETIKRFMEDRP